MAGPENSPPRFMWLLVVRLFEFFCFYSAEYFKGFDLPYTFVGLITAHSCILGFCDGTDGSAPVALAVVLFDFATVDDEVVRVAVVAVVMERTGPVYALLATALEGLAAPIAGGR